MGSRAPAAEVLELIHANPAHAGILTDFDGTLSPIVDEPDQARPLDGVPALLEELTHRYPVVAVLSGRPVAFLQQWLPPSLLLSGLYGLEVVRDGVRNDHPSGGMWREVVDDVATVARATGPDEMRVESKGLSLTLHYRGHPEIETTVRELAERQAARSGLSVRPARMSFELHPPIAADKGTAVRDLADGLAAVCFLGDDLGDLPAFAELQRLADEGVATVRVAVRSDEAPEELLDAADVVVDGPEGARDLLRELL
ncbi:MAG: trehalose 6-phosphate phosphatase [Acidimicrobiaceae bacterium]